MQEEFDKAIAALKSSQLGTARPRRAVLPALVRDHRPARRRQEHGAAQLGPALPVPAKPGDGSVKGLGGTRNCDWWLTNEAVCSTPPAAGPRRKKTTTSGWRSCGLLKKHRPRKPLNGLIAAISIGDVVNAQRRRGRRARHAHARAHRRGDRPSCDVSLPVYVLFTKCDLIEGFVEMFGDLRSERARADLGLHHAADRAAACGPERAFERASTSSSSVLEQRSHARAWARSAASRRAQLIYAFPQQFAALRRNLEPLHPACCSSTTSTARRRALRGVYFTSGTQEGRPFNLLLNRLAEASASTGASQVPSRRSEELLPARRVHEGDLRGQRRRVGEPDRR